MRFLIAATLAFAVMLIDLNGFWIDRPVAYLQLASIGSLDTVETAMPVPVDDSSEARTIQLSEDLAARFAQFALFSSTNSEAQRTPEPAEDDTSASDDVQPELSTNDICVALAAAAEANDLPVGFFARIIWQESRFKRGQTSSAGAQGVAQFMPKTAAEIGLDDPFDPLKALPASARFLRRLYNQFGNLGLAAAAYNAGSGRITNWIAKREDLPVETKNYVRSVTGSPAENWTAASQTIALKRELPSQAPCEGIGGLSKGKEAAKMSVELTPAIREIIRKVKLEEQRAVVAKIEKAKKAKSRLALSRRRKPETEVAQKATHKAAAKSRVTQDSSTHRKKVTIAVLPGPAKHQDRAPRQKVDVASAAK